jgi:hypothetical protein
MIIFSIAQISTTIQSRKHKSRVKVAQYFKENNKLREKTILYILSTNA